MLDDVGFFDETFGMYYEDLDLAWRGRLRGWRFHYTPEAVVHHIHCGTSGEWSPFFLYHVERNRVFASIKNGPARLALRALAVTGVAGEPGLFYFGAAAGGVWKSVNSGATWTPIFDSEPNASIGAIAVAPSNHDVIYVGTGEGALRGDITWGDGVYKSTDGGKSWTSVGLKDTRQIGTMIVDPTNPDIVLVAAEGHAYAIVGWASEPDFYRKVAGAVPIAGSEPGLYRAPLR